MLIRLSDEDRKTFDLDVEFLDIDLLNLQVRELRELQKLGYPSPVDLIEALDLTAAIGLDGGWQRLHLGRRKPDGDADVAVEKPEEQAVIQPDYDAWSLTIWLALRRAGREIPWDECLPHLFAMQYRLGEPVEEGKDPSTPETTSTDGSRSTPPR